MSEQNLYEAMTQTLQTMQANLSESIFHDPQKFTAALNDIVRDPEEVRVKNLLRIAICDLKAYTRLKRSKTDNFTAISLAEEMTEGYMIPEEISTCVINCIAAFAGYTSHNAVPKSAPKRPSPSDSKTVHFGKRDWRVLDLQSGKALLLSDKIIEKRPYHEDLNSGASWSECSLRRYLNREFYDSFSKSEKARILETKTTTPGNIWFGTEGGDEVSEKIFLLSIEEVAKYFGGTEQLHDRKNKINVIHNRFNPARKANDENDAPGWWWLRSPGDDPDFAAYVCADGVLHISGSLVSIAGGAGGGLRPALWLSFST